MTFQVPRATLKKESAAPGFFKLVDGITSILSSTMTLLTSSAIIFCCIMVLSRDVRCLLAGLSVLSWSRDSKNNCLSVTVTALGFGWNAAKKARDGLTILFNRTMRAIIIFTIHDCDCDAVVAKHCLDLRRVQDVLPDFLDDGAIFLLK